MDIHLRTSSVFTRVPWFWHIHILHTTYYVLHTKYFFADNILHITYCVLHIHIMLQITDYILLLSNTYYVVHST